MKVVNRIFAVENEKEIKQSLEQSLMNGLFDDWLFDAV